MSIEFAVATHRATRGWGPGLDSASQYETWLRQHILYVHSDRHPKLNFQIQIYYSHLFQPYRFIPWWIYQMETFSALMALCAGKSLVSGEFPSQRPVTRRIDVFFDLRLNELLSKHHWRRWFWRHRAHYDVTVMQKQASHPTGHHCTAWSSARLCFYQMRSAWSMDQGSTKKRSAVHNFVPTVTKFCVMWEGLSLPHDTKFGNCRGEIVDRRMVFIWSLIHGSGWSRLIKADPDEPAPNGEQFKDD